MLARGHVTAAESAWIDGWALPLRSRTARLASPLLKGARRIGHTPAGGQCLGQWVENTTLVNPDNPGFFDSIDKNQDGIICIKDWTGPDPDPDIGFLAIDNVGKHNS